MIETFTIFSGIIALLSIYKKFSNRLVWFLLIIIPITFLDGLRWEMGTDWSAYYTYFNGGLQGFRNTTFDPGFVVYTDIINYFTDNYSIYLLSISFITYVVAFYGIFRITEKNFLSIFYLMGTLPWYAGSMRQMLAVACFVWALKAIIDRKPIRYITLMLLGVSFHATLAVFILMYIFFGISTFAYIVLLASIVIMVPLVPFLVQTLELITSFYGFNKDFYQYVSGGAQHTGANPILGFSRKIITVFGLFIFSVIAVSSNNNNDNRRLQIKFFFALSSLTIVFYYIGTYQVLHVASRVDLYVGLVSTSILIGLIDNSMKKKFNRLIFYLFVLSLVGVFYSRLMWMDLFHPYSSIFYNYNLNRVLH
jgi:hypothetical protein